MTKHTRVKPRTQPLDRQLLNYFHDLGDGRLPHVHAIARREAPHPSLTLRKPLRENLR